MEIEINNTINVIIRCYDCNEVLEISSITNDRLEVEVTVYKCDCTDDDAVGRI